VAQDRIRIEQHTRAGPNTWTIRDYQNAGDTLSIESVGISIPLARIYRRIEIASE
jgi:hypothetical protein